MAEFFVWVTTRRIRDGTLDLREAWEPPEPPDGMTRAFEWVGDDGQTVVGVSHPNVLGAEHLAEPLGGLDEAYLLTSGGGSEPRR
ncbi:MAG: hypothetical protein ACRDM8_08405 [Gaiellaceae bacterium]